MRRTTAAAVGTLTGTALIMAVRFSVATTPLAAAPPTFDVAEVAPSGPAPTGSAPGRPQRNSERNPDDSAGNRDDDAPSTPTRGRTPTAPASGLTDGRFTGTPATNPYGTVQVAVAISNGRVTGTAVTYPRTGQSATINAGAVPKLKQQTLEAQSAQLDAVSGATYTSQSYIESLQAALDAAGA